MQRLGILIGVADGAQLPAGDIFVDAISACPTTGSCAGTGTGSFDWETPGSVDGWSASGSTVFDTATSQSTAQALTGTGSLAATFSNVPAVTSWTNPNPATRQIVLKNPNAYCGQTVTYHVWMPPGAKAAGLELQTYARQNGWVWNSGTYVTATEGAWTTIPYTLPEFGYRGLQEIGLQFIFMSTTANYSGTAYIDAVNW
jgi:hypothetical protein